MTRHYLASQSLAALMTHSNRQRIGRSEKRRLTIEFAEREHVDSVAQIICDRIAHVRDSYSFRKTCENYLRYGISSFEIPYLQICHLMPRAELDDPDDFGFEFRLRSQFDNADPSVDRPWEGMQDPASLFRRTTIGFRNSLDADELVEPMPVELDDIYETLMPSRGSLRTLDGLSAFECLKSLRDAGLLSSIEMRGFAVRYIEYEEECMLPILCHHFDATGMSSDFDAYLKAKFESNRVEWKITGF